MGAAATKSSRSSTAGWAGLGEQDGTVYERNRCRKASSHLASPNPVDLGIWAGKRCAPCRARSVGELPGGFRRSGSGGHGEGLRRSRGEAAGAKPGTSPVDRNAVNVGTVHVAVPAPRASLARRGGIGASSAEGRARGGAVVVLRGRESRSHGEGRQCVEQGKDCHGAKTHR